MRSVVCTHLTYAFGIELPSHMHALCWPIGTVAIDECKLHVRNALRKLNDRVMAMQAQRTSRW
jgi:hypothetical protein